MPTKVHVHLKVIRNKVELLKAERKGKLVMCRCTSLVQGLQEYQYSVIEQEGVCVGSE